MTPQQIVTDRRRAAQLKALMTTVTCTSGRQQQSSAKDLKGSLSVKILTAIPAGDYTAQQAAVMDRVAGAMVDTGQRVPVRHVGESAVPANTIVTPVPCGRHGLCFIRDSVPLTGTTTIGRYVVPAGPLPAELGTEDTSWTFGSPMSGVGATWFCDYALPTASYTSILPDGRYLIRKKMMPIRITANAFHAGVPGAGISSGYGGTAGIVGQFRQELLWSRATSSATPPSGSHLHQVTLRAADLPLPIVCCFGRTPYGAVTTRAFVTHYRILLGGGDITGIVSVGSQQIDTSSDGVSVSALLNRTFAATSATAATIQYDLWITCELMTNLVSWPTISGAQQHFDVAVSPVGNWDTLRLGPVNPNAQRSGSDRYQFVLDTAGPGGLTTLTAASTADTAWTFTESIGSVQQTKVSGTAQGFVSLNWWNEIAQVQVGLNAQSTTAAAGVARYFPEASGDYAEMIFPNAFPHAFGTWNPQGSTVFRLSGVQMRPGAWPTLWATKGYDAPSSYYSGFPQSITVTRI